MAVKPSKSETTEEKKVTGKKLKSRTKFTIIAIINVIWYTIAVLVMAALDKTVPSELTVAWFSAWTVELGLLYGIKIKDKE